MALIWRSSLQLIGPTLEGFDFQTTYSVRRSVAPALRARAPVESESFTPVLTATFTWATLASSATLIVSTTPTFAALLTASVAPVAAAVLTVSTTLATSAALTALITLVAFATLAIFLPPSVFLTLVVFVILATFPVLASWEVPAILWAVADGLVLLTPAFLIFLLLLLWSFGVVVAPLVGCELIDLLPLSFSFLALIWLILSLLQVVSTRQPVSLTLTVAPSFSSRFRLPTPFECVVAPPSALATSFPRVSLPLLRRPSWLLRRALLLLLPLFAMPPVSFEPLLVIAWFLLAPLRVSFTEQFLLASLFQFFIFLPQLPSTFSVLQLLVLLST